MSPRRNAVAGVALAAAGVVYRRLTGRKVAPSPPPAPPAATDVDAIDSVDDAAVARARGELAEELARRAARSER
jgi:hypothetical protein